MPIVKRHTREIKLKLKDQYGNKYAVIKHRLTGKGLHGRLLFTVVHKGDMTKHEKLKIKDVS